MSAFLPRADRVVRTVCSPNCSGTCGVNAFVRDDRILKIEPASFPEPGFERICLKGIAMAMQRVDHPDRLKYPLRRAGARGEGKWERMSWEEAFRQLAGKLTALAEQHGPESRAWMTMSGNYGFKACTVPARIANCLGGTTFSHGGMMGDLNCAMGPIPVIGFGETADTVEDVQNAKFGLGASANDLADLVHAKYILMFGRNAADTDHSEMRFLFDAMERGAKVVVVDPRFSRTAAKADEWIAPRPGTDAALVLGMIHTIISEGLMDTAYVQRYTNAPFLVHPRTGALLRGKDVAGGSGEGCLVWDPASRRPAVPASVAEAALRGPFAVRLADGTAIECPTACDRMREAWAEYTPERAAEICEVPAEQIRHVAREYAAADPAWLWHGAGPQRYHHGHLAIRAYVTLGAITGNVGKAYAGVNCLDGAHMRLTARPPEAWEAPSGQRAKMLPGVHMLEIITRGEPWPIKSLWITAYGMGTQSPSFDRFVREALPQLELFVVTEQMMTPAAQYADIVLPCVSHYEEEMDLVGGGEHWFIQLRQRAIPPLGESKNDYEIFRGLAQAMGCGEHWQMSNEEVCEYILKDHQDPAIRGIDWETLRRVGAARVEIPRPHIPFKSRSFGTPSGRMELYTEMLLPHGEAVVVHKEPLESRAQPLARKYPLAMLSPKHVHSTHSQHTMLPWIREQLPEPTLVLHPSDAAMRGIRAGDLVRVFNDRGQFMTHATLSEGMKPGTVTVPQGFWPEHFVEGHHARLGRIAKNAVQELIIETNYPVWDILVEVQRVANAGSGVLGPIARLRGPLAATGELEP